MAFTTTAVSVADLVAGQAVLDYTAGDGRGRSFVDLAVPDADGRPTAVSGLPTVTNVTQSPSVSDSAEPWASQDTIPGSQYTVILAAAAGDLVTGQSPLVTVVDDQAVFVTATD